MKHQIGIIGLVIGLLAVGVAIFQNDLRPRPPDPPETSESPDPSLRDLAVKAGKRMIREKLLEKAEPEPDRAANDELREPHDGIALTYMALGFLAMILGVISWVKKEHIRISGGAVSLGLIAVAWQYVLIGVMIAVVIFVLANLGA